MKTITLEDGTKVQVSDEQYEALVPKANWRAKGDEVYWSVDIGGDVLSILDCYKNSDDFRYNTGNYFRTREDAGAYRDYLLAKGKVEMAVRERNGNWTPVWSDGKESKYFVGFHAEYEDIVIYTVLSNQNIASMDEHYCATEDIAQSIINDFTLELDIIRKWVNR